VLRTWCGGVYMKRVIFACALIFPAAVSQAGEPQSISRPVCAKDESATACVEKLGVSRTVPGRTVSEEPGGGGAAVRLSGWAEWPALYDWPSPAWYEGFPDGSSAYQFRFSRVEQSLSERKQSGGD
jgi:hypothetical protein